MENGKTRTELPKLFDETTAAIIEIALRVRESVPVDQFEIVFNAIVQSTYGQYGK
jgi:hypothetical protein